MKIQAKLILSRTVFALLVAITGYLSIVTSQNVLEDTIGQQSVFLSASLMDEIDQKLHDRIKEIKLYAQDGALVAALEESNREFAALEDVESYIDELDGAWQDAPKESTTSFMRSLIDHPVSKEMRKQIVFYEEFHPQGVFSEIFVTNKYGANVAQSGRTSDYRQNDEKWWQEAAENRFYLKDVEFDESAGVFSTDIAVRVIDSNGEFAGVVKAVLNIGETTAILQRAEKEAEKEEQELEFKLLTQTGNTIYTTESGFKPLEDVSDAEFFSPITATTGYFIAEESTDEEEELFAYSTSRGDGDFKGLGWILLVEHKTAEILAPVTRLRTTILTISSILVIFALGSGFLLARSIARPIVELGRQAEEIGKGNLNVRSGIRRKDELGVLAKTIDDMVINLKKYQTKLLESEKQHSQKLEKEVAAKTQELQKTVADLEKSKHSILNIMEDLRESNAHLKELDKAKSNFLNVISHELKTPLTAVFAYLDIIGDAKDKFNKDQQKGFDAIRRNNNQLKALINNILEMSRIEAGKFELLNNEFNVKEKIAAAVDNLHILSQNKGIELVAKVDSADFTITSDEQRFEEILNNLISNAIKFTDKGVVTVAAEKAGEFISVQVIDTGVGIPKDKVKNLFQKFYQVDSSISRRYGGTGLGLSITKQLIELQGGTISVESAEGQGTTFSFTLPLTPVAQPLSEKKQSQPSQGGART